MGLDFQSLQQIKDAITVAPILRYFDPAVTTVLQRDASSTALGAVLMQNGQPVTYAIRALTKTEREYAQIEKELLQGRRRESGMARPASFEKWPFASGRLPQLPV